MSIISAVKGFGHCCKIKITKYSPQICLVLGIAGVIGGTIFACNATLKVKDHIEDRDNKLEDLKQKYLELLAVTGDEENTEVTVTENDICENKEYKREVMKTHALTVFNIAKDFAPALICSGAGIGLLCHGQGILSKRYLAMTAAYGGLQKSFNDYRDNVIKRYGKQVDEELLYGVEHVTFVDPETNIEKVIPCTEISKYGKTSLNTRVLFNEISPYWTKDPENNKIFIELTIHNMNEKLNARGRYSNKAGVMFLNEVLDELGLPRTEAGQMLGWQYDPNVINKIDAGIYDRAHMMEDGVLKFLDGDEPSIWLDFNVDGNVLELI